MSQVSPPSLSQLWRVPLVFLDDLLKEQTMKEFNYKKAWQKLVWPAWEKLRESDRVLALTIGSRAPYGQSDNLDMAWPMDGLREMLEIDFTDLELATAARVVYLFGHWAPGVRQQPLLEDAEWNSRYMIADRLQERGSYWKFSNFCDQILHLRLGLPRRSDREGVSYLVHEGGLRICYASKWEWTWQEVGWATRENWEKIKDIRVHTEGWDKTKNIRDFNEHVYTTRKQRIEERLKSADFTQLTDISEFMEERSR